MIPKKREIDQIITKIRGEKKKWVNNEQFYSSQITKSEESLLRVHLSFPYNIFIWFSKAMIHELFGATQIFVNGTFKITPHGFVQVIIILVRIESLDNYASVCFGLMQTKTQENYAYLFHLLKLLMGNHEPSFITIDFEMAQKKSAGFYFSKFSISWMLLSFWYCPEKKVRRVKL
eukprot:Anaeramoba_ignava/a95811_23.p1 GENE.a95811_23~~a95811_23.p1  ORF type:complete len:175 (+),score=22.72 a95811_23:825-1349(+)